MSADHLDLGRRLLVAGCPWRERMYWIRPPSGAPDDGGDRGLVVETSDDGAAWDSRNYEPLPDDAVPDLSDPLTVAAAWLELEERLGRPVSLYWETWDGAWYCWASPRGAAGSERCATLAEARAQAVVLAWEEVPHENH
jgi:hypothetical protein